MTPLTNCPFCRKPPGVDAFYTHGFIECGCGACGPAVSGGSQADIDAEAIAAWNTRPTEDALRARIAELEAEVARLNAIVNTSAEWFGHADGGEETYIDIHSLLDCHADGEIIEVQRCIEVGHSQFAVRIGDEYSLFDTMEEAEYAAKEKS